MIGSAPVSSSPLAAGFGAWSVSLPSIGGMASVAVAALMGAPVMAGQSLINLDAGGGVAVEASLSADVLVAGQSGTNTLAGGEQITLTAGEGAVLFVPDDAVVEVQGQGDHDILAPLSASVSISDQAGVSALAAGEEQITAAGQDAGFALFGEAVVEVDPQAAPAIFGGEVFLDITTEAGAQRVVDWGRAPAYRSMEVPPRNRVIEVRPRNRTIEIT